MFIHLSLLLRTFASPVTPSSISNRQVPFRVTKEKEKQAMFIDVVRVQYNFVKLLLVETQRKNRYSIRMKEKKIEYLFIFLSLVVSEFASAGTSSLDEREKEKEKQAMFIDVVRVQYNFMKLLLVET